MRLLLLAICHGVTTHRTLARLGDLLKALERLASVEQISSGHLQAGLGGIFCGYYLCSARALSFAPLCLNHRGY